MQEPDLYDTYVDKDRTIRVEWFDISTLDQLPSVLWQQVYVIGNLEGKVPVVLYEGARPNLPGGKTDEGESIEETLKRELQEEINCYVVDWNIIGYQKLTEPDGTVSYQLRVYADLEKIGEFKNDPGGSVIGYKLINLSELNNEIQYGKVGERLMGMVGAKYLQ